MIVKSTLDRCTHSPQYLERGDLEARSIVQRPFTVEEAKTGREVGRTVFPEG